MNEENFKRLKNNFKLRNIEVEYFKSLEDVKSYILDIIPISSTIGIGHSATLQKMNITNTLLEKGNVIYDKELAKNLEECEELNPPCVTLNRCC